MWVVARAYQGVAFDEGRVEPELQHFLFFAEHAAGLVLHEKTLVDDRQVRHRDVDHRLLLVHLLERRKREEERRGGQGRERSADQERKWARETE